VPIERGKPPAPWISRLVIGLALTSLVAGWLGDLLLAAVIDKHPVLLIAMNPRNRNLALASPLVDTIPYYTVGFIRLVASDPLNFLIGYWFGDRALAWVKRRSRTYGPIVDDASGFFARWSKPIIFAAPNNIVCILSGASGVTPRTFLLLNVSGTLTRLYVVRRFADYFSEEVGAVTGFIADNRVPILILSAVAVGWTIFGEFRGNDSEVKALLELERHPDQRDADEVEADEAASDDADDRAPIEDPDPTER